MTVQEKLKEKILILVFFLAVIVLSPLWISIIIYGEVVYRVQSVRLHLAVWLQWLPRDKDILFVHSDSPVWRDYIEQHILPVIRERAVILNWSQRSTPQWGPSLAIAVFQHFGGAREFNPMGVVFLPFRRAKVFRFHAAFRDYKHGKPEKLLAMERDFFEYAHTGANRLNA